MRSFELPELLFLLRAAQWTIVLSLVSFLCGGIGGIAVALLRVGRRPVLRVATIGWIQLFQGTPLLMQLFLVYYGLGVFGLRLDPWTAVVIAFTCYASAFLGEIWRGSIEAVPATQWEAGTALALRRLQILRLVIVPQAVRIAVPPTVGFLVQLVKGTSLASIIGFVELSRAGALVNNATFQPMLVYGVVGALYFALCYPISLLSRRLEQRIDRRVPQPTQL